MRVPAPPRLARWILTRLLGAEDREFGLGDASEEFAERARDDWRAARAWYRRQAAAAIRYRFARATAPRLSHLRPGALTDLFGSLGQDVRYAWRGLRGAPAYTAIAVVTLAAGIGSNAAVYTLLDTVVLRPLPFADAERIVTLRNVFTDRPGDWALSFPDYLDYQAGVEALEQLAAFQSHSPGLGSDDGAPALRVRATDITWNLLPVLGITPALGRAFRPEEDRPDAGVSVALLSWSLWRERFGSDAGVLGTTIRLDGIDHTVVGVTPRGFSGAIGGDVLPGAPTDVWLPYRSSFSADGAHLRGLSNVSVIGKLRPDATLVQANEQVAAVAAALAEQFPGDREGESARLRPAQEAASGRVRGSLFMLFGAVCVLLLIACANVANLTLGRAATRRREIALRVALGARRGRLVRQLLVESIVLALAGGFVGAAMASAGIRAASSTALLDAPRLQAATLDLRVMLFLVAVSLATGVVFGIVPALNATRGVEAIMHDDSRTASDRGSHLMRNGLAVAQMALAAVLLIGAGLLVRSFQRALEVDPGFSPHGVLTARLQLPHRFVDDQWPRAVTFFEQLLPRLERLPGVDSVAAAYQLPTDGGWANAFRIEGRDPDVEGGDPYAIFRPVTHDYFRTAGIEVVRGRGLRATDGVDAPPVVVVNEAFVRALFENEDPIGQRLVYGNWWTDGPPEYEIVGVVNDVLFSGRTSQPYPATYFAHPQQPVRELSVMLRTSGDPAALIGMLRAQVAELDPELPVDSIATLQELLAADEGSRRSLAMLLTVFATVALALAAIGVYGVLAFIVSRRTKELGIRVALGARGADVRRLVLGYGARVTLIGLAIGLGSALALGRFIESMLFDVAPTDPATVAGVCLLLAAVALVACWLPAARATRVDPVRSLRTD